MVTLRARVPNVAEQFSQGKFVVRKTNRPFSAISVDHAHEQNNAIVKGTARVTDLMQNPKAELWVAFGVGNKKRYILAHKIASKMGDERSRALPMFHAFTGCDTVSSFAGIGKKTAFQVWTAAPEITPSLC